MFTLVDAIRRNERLVPQREAIFDGTRRLTHGELADRAWRIAAGLRAQGVKPGDTVGVLAGNTAFGIETFLGIVAAGAAFVPYNWRWATEELAHGINETGARVVLVGDGFDAAIAEVLAGDDLEAPVAVVHEGDEFDHLLRSEPIKDVPVQASDAACILFTGGTTGFSKGVVLSHSAILTNAVNEIADCRIGGRPNDRGLVVTPLFHSAALLCWFLPHYVTGNSSVLVHKFVEEEIADLVARESITNMFLVPNMIRRMLKSGTFDTDGFRNNFKALHTGAGLLRMPDKLAVSSLIPDVDLFFRYGLTEAGPMVTRLLPQDMLRPEIDGSIGTEYLLTEVELRDLYDGAPTAVGEIGEICVRGPNLMTGYFGRPEATKEVLDNGWLRTGDLAVRDENGYLYFRDRAKDMIKTGGENVYSSEIEQLLHTHPAVMEAAVLGVPSEEWDEEVRAVIAVRPGQTVTETEIATFLRKHLAGYKVPKMIALVGPNALPMNPSGKIVKTNIRATMGW
ncbi:O-succinylbenzoate-CoA ligase [Rhodococcus opacus PD630]|uniref:class I adenylate-forming enzyme family protein n=1 Tax=Rhodococcus TaxID=1827 RepID=UPI00029CB529|nr:MULTISPECIES: AMP-binding protein [Rhodococcus]KXF48750.1 fatty-acid--CoA ligase [Rhodococcus sp. SC4]RZK72384.1 MAG: long-chain fatty acid--CoA ligase [Rhodococcus sp. (in: high G+C Gram-positive bacteria)]AHK34298.1 2-succinylbenzoate--CoA ligase [Rhodococcus opacus PD630]EHI39791.1 O-succinylbenzoate-CoA ligase [Rhodococcus opacus PD630]KXX61949.1 fatty-acid--CoA ligase [Rhodococcus sp. LB1]